MLAVLSLRFSEIHFPRTHFSSSLPFTLHLPFAGTAASAASIYMGQEAKKEAAERGSTGKTFDLDL